MVGAIGSTVSMPFHMIRGSSTEERAAAGMGWVGGGMGREQTRQRVFWSSPVGTSMSCAA